ncbi:MAG: Swt1 family HEPN domain-containing protein [Deltaproteobacteria bacterium]|nr:Swt1 family HEPN domain-containing protein [Deltaproteobacteria bacterium]
MEVDVTQALKDAENSLREFISNILGKKLGSDWANNCGVSPERVQRWQARKAEEEKRQKFGTVEERLIYYADFYDLKTILKKNWGGEFSETFGDWKIMEVWLDELGRLRDPDAHRRELLPHQKYLAVGIVGEIRTRIVRYRSKQETSEDYFPRIESARDNFGNMFPSDTGNSVYTRTILRPNDIVDFIITASDPLDAELEYGIAVGGFISNVIWQKENTFSVRIIEKHIETMFTIKLYIRSPRRFHAHSSHDDSMSFVYDVLPSKKA